MLPPGIIQRDVVISGSYVSLLGASHVTCDEASRSILTGKLTVTGTQVTVFDVELRGAVTISGDHVRIQDTCTGCFAQACIPSSGGGGGEDAGEVGRVAENDAAPSDAGATSASDAGAVAEPDASEPQDAHAPPAVPDAGAPMDAPATADAAHAADAE